MKRELKFRAWANTDDGLKMKNFDFFECDNGLWFPIDEHIDDYEETIMQYTGLRDKNGKEIYEGDIVKRFGVVKIVEYKMGKSFCGFNIGAGYDYKKSGNSMEVIGNIYENKELLK